MKVYHGTNVRFDRIDLSKCNPNNDFGQGFYVTAIKQHADQRAKDIAERYGGEPVTMEFEFDEKYLTDSNFHTLVFEKPSREWVEFVMKNREPTHQIMLGTQVAIVLIQPDNAFISKTEDIITNVSIALVNDFKLNILEAMNIIYNSETFTQLTSRENLLFEKSWLDIYKMLKEEL